jgi:hypothetical protein
MEKKWDDVESFVNDLKTALDDEARTIRETELDQVGEYQEATLSFRVSEDGVGRTDEKTQVFIDKLGRALLPPDSRYRDLEKIYFPGEGNGSEPVARDVVNVETRFKGQKISSYIVYLEAKE